MLPREGVKNPLIYDEVCKSMCYFRFYSTKDFLDFVSIHVRTAVVGKLSVRRPVRYIVGVPHLSARVK